MYFIKPIICLPLCKLLTTLTLLAIVPRCHALLDLSKQYDKSSVFPTPMGEEIIAIAESEEDVNAFVAIECGKVIAEYGEQDDIRHLFSVTKSWTGLLLGIAEKENLISLTETLEDVWPDENIWENIEDAEDRKKTTIEQLVQMRGGYDMPT